MPIKIKKVSSLVSGLNFAADDSLTAASSTGFNTGNVLNAGASGFVSIIPKITTFQIK